MPDGPLLREVSRSFYLSLRLLPRAMRPAAGVGYLLARTSDTLADAADIPMQLRLAALEQFANALEQGGGFDRDWKTEIWQKIDHAGERKLLQQSSNIFQMLGELPPDQAELVRGVVRTIIGGQRLDLTRFGEVQPENPRCLPDAAALDDYAWRVAGCVGEFWTRLGLLTLGKSFSTEEPDCLLAWGIHLGKALQWVNILRDLPEDLANGRCYLPVANPADRSELLRCQREWIDLCEPFLLDGLRYAHAMESRRLRATVELPAMLGINTLQRLRTATWPELERRIKVPRRTVYWLLLRALAGPSRRV